ncbi:MAG: hypothetical protein DHS20C21_07860 [Gemmatimonadota bacterium]|nr:MAG: hypothetical protein DHS20C21_07860 [Gemmatimonadota bacterium]
MISQRLRLPLPSLLLVVLATGWLFAGCGGGSSDNANSGARSQQSGADAPTSPMDPELAQAGVTELDLAGPHVPPADYFNPDGAAVTPALGGRVIQHIASEPPNLNFATENSAVIRWVLREIHSALLEFNLDTWEYDPTMATAYTVEDMVLLNEGGDQPDAVESSGQRMLYGNVTDDGDAYLLTPGSAHNTLPERRILKSEVESVQRGTVFTFDLRNDVLWHDGHPFDVNDVLFSWSIYSNPHVDCDEKRSTMAMLANAEIVGPDAIRFFYKEQYFRAIAVFDLAFTLLPSHLYNLNDPDNPDYNPDATDAEQGTYINENPHNLDWVGLGPYQLTKWERGRFLEAKKFDGFYNKDPAFSGYMDTLRWTHVDDDNLAFQALLNGEVDIFDRVKSEDFMGAATQQEVFTKNFYKSYTYLGSLGYTGWNLFRPHLSDVRVRTALAHAFDVKEWIRTNYEGLALPATGSQFWFGPGYNRDVKLLPYDIERAQELLAEAGWYDRDGNGIVDKDGEDLEIEFLMPSGNKASEKLLQKMQESYEKIGVSMKITAMEWAQFLERILDRDFDACNLAWALTDVESDPFSLWHSKEADPNRRTSNHSGLQDPEVDRLIDAIRKELDPDARHLLYMDLHARLYELQPYLFGWNVPKKIAFNRALHGVKLYKFSPGYRLRDMYYAEGTPGTRPLGSST